MMILSGHTINISHSVKCSKLETNIGEFRFTLYNISRNRIPYIIDLYEFAKSKMYAFVMETFLKC